MLACFATLIRERIWELSFGVRAIWFGFLIPAEICGPTIFVLMRMRGRSNPEIGEVTARILEFNSRARIAERQLFVEAGSYSSALSYEVQKFDDLGKRQELMWQELRSNRKFNVR